MGIVSLRPTEGQNVGRLNVGIAVQGSFLGIFNASIRESIFNKTFPLLQVCAPKFIFSFLIPLKQFKQQQ
jgi:hypothetical protein